MTPRAQNLSPAALLWVLLPSCNGKEDPGTEALADAAWSAPSDGAAACIAESCACVGAAGVRRCDDGGLLGSCDCPTVPLSSFDGGIITVGLCPTGSYAGNFEGTAGFLIPTSDVMGLDFFDDQPPLQITLGHASGAEFAVVGNGVMHGNANGVFPFEATIMGRLDCETKRFTATLVGSVQLVLDGVRNDFTGTMESTYDSAQQAFSAGAWTVTGSGADGGFDLGLTGNGSWSAQHVDGGADAGR